MLASGEAVLDPELSDSRARQVLNHYTILLYVLKPENDLTQSGHITKTSNTKTEDNTPLLTFYVNPL